FTCVYCNAQIEHRDHRLANHIASHTKCKDAPTAARTAAHMLMADKKNGKKRAADEEDEPAPSEDSVVHEPSSQPPAKKKKATQSNLDGVVDRPMMVAQQDAANQKLLKYFIHSNTPFANADNMFLSDFTNEIRPSFNVASRYMM
ncbi:hypothetical protein GGX14DRAFT_315436, partial [Mycena pura]